MDCGVPFCQAGMMIGGMASGCPLNNLIPEWNDLVYQGKWELALRRLRTTNRFPEFTSRVCPALCEAACTCGDVTGSSVTVRENEHAIVETGYAKGWLHAAPPPARTGKSVAVIGSGPSGLSVAEYLNIRGHAVTIFERADRVGGLLMYGIPNMKLDKSVIDGRRIKIMPSPRRKLAVRWKGVEFRTNEGVDWPSTPRRAESQESACQFWHPPRRQGFINAGQWSGGMSSSCRQCGCSPDPTMSGYRPAAGRRGQDSWHWNR